jgi:L-alanine-DL-glutamate epimerase-like enolase superfamily enzyme
MVKKRLRRIIMYNIHKDFGPHKPVSTKELNNIMEEKVVDTSRINKQVIIQSAALIHNDEGYFLRIRGRNGEEGIAPCSERAEYLHILLKKKIIPYIMGKDARDLENLFFEAFVSDLNYKIQGLAWWCCIAWVESAILDMLAKAAGVPVTDLLGGRKRDELELYVASGNRHTTPEEEVDILQERVNKLGVKAIKFKLGGRMRKNADSMAGRSEGLLHLARKHFGDDMIIHSDGNGSFDAEKAIETGRIVESINGYFYEEPCPFDDLWDLKAAADALEVPIAFGEQETSLRRFAWIIENDAAQVLQPDLQYTGGFIQCIKVARMAKAAGKVVTPHVSGGYASYNMLIFCSVIDNPGHYHEYKGYRGAEDHTEGNLKLHDGRVSIPRGIGLGLDLAFVNKPGSTILFEELAE